MGKIRVYELAKELGMESKDVIRRLGKMGADVKNHMSTVEDKFADMLRDIVRPKLILEQKNAEAAIKKDDAPKGQASAAGEEKKAPTQPGAAEKISEDRAAAAPAEPTEKKPAPEKTAEPVKTAVKPVTEPVKPALKDQPRQQGVFAKENQPRQQGVFAKQNQPRQQGVFAKDNNQPRQQGVFAKQNQPRQQGVFSKQNQNQNQNQGKNDNRGQGRYDNRNNDRKNFTGGQGGPRNDNRPNQNRPDHRGPQGTQPRFDNRNNQNRNDNRGGQGGPRYDNRNNQGRPDNRVPNKDGQFKGNRPQNGPGHDRPFKAAPPSDTIKPQEKKDNRRFDQKKKTNYDSRKRDFERSSFDSNPHRRNQKQNIKKRTHKEEMPPVVPKTVMIGETVIISDLAKAMSKTAAELIKVLMGLGFLATVNQEVDAETAIILGQEFGVTVQVRVDDKMEILVDEEDAESTLEERPPIVTVMGHVDHGKTSLLDAIRTTNVIAKEAGGITQHIGAYQVEISGKKITFLDTPGHEAFTEMRARGAQVTDIAILVVAADDGVMPQTVEAINHAKAAKVPIIVAINKMDKPGANPDKIRQELTEYELIDEEWGGNTVMVPISAKKEEGIANLLEMVLLVAEMQELKSNPNRNARGTVIESKLDKGRGAVATVLVQKGTLHVGDILVCGTEFAKVRAMVDEKGRRVKAAKPSMPVEVLGFSVVPPAGEIFVCVDDEKDARYIAEHNSRNKRESEMDKTVKVSLDDLFRQISEGAVKDLNIVLKADVHGSVEALHQSIVNLSTDEVRVNVIHKGVGAIVETDVMLAEASNALIIGFNVRPDAHTKKAAEKAGVEILMYRVIYEAIDSIKAAMSGLLDPEFKEVILGHVEVRDVIKVPKVGAVAGSYVVDGKVVRNGKLRVLRNGIVIHEGDIASLRRFKDDVKEVQTGYECGICIADFNDVKVEDQIEIYEMVETKRTIE
ncbi:MAG TPA: translation initiation factor IF-2 [Clostridiales bacterium]|nr:translation initiation factor IF-2 [Clostridiales bacterium]